MKLNKQEFVLIDSHIHKFGLVDNINFKYQNTYNVWIRHSKDNKFSMVVHKDKLRALNNPLARLVGPMISDPKEVAVFGELCLKHFESWSLPL